MSQTGTRAARRWIMGYIFGFAGIAWFVYAAFFTSMFTPELAVVIFYMSGYAVAMAILFSNVFEKP
jgi:hypothetical protein